jgi:hypothetical protein
MIVQQIYVPLALNRILSTVVVNVHQEILWQRCGRMTLIMNYLNVKVHLIVQQMYVLLALNRIVCMVVVFVYQHGPLKNLFRLNYVESLQEI